MKLGGAFISALVFFVTRAEGHEHPPICPKGLPSEKYSHEEILKLRRDTTSRLWSIPIPLSPDAQLLRDQLLTMSTSDNEDWEPFSSAATFWIWTYLPTMHIVPPNLCPFAKIVNATPDAMLNHNCSDLKAPLLKVVDQIQFGTLIIINSGLNNTKCGKLILDNKGDPKIIPRTSNERGPSPLTQLANNETCHEDGRVYKIGTMLDFIGEKYTDVPGATKDIWCILRTLYRSSSLQDNLIALMTLASASPALQSVVCNYRDEMKYTFFSLGGQGPLPQCCCGKYRKDLTQIYKESLSENSRIFDFSMKQFC